MGDAMGKLKLKKYHQKRKKIKYKYIIILILIFLSYKVIFSLADSINIKISNQNTIKLLLNQTNHHIKNSSNIFNKMLKVITNMDIKKPTTILENNLTHIVNIKNINQGIITNMEYKDDYSDLEDLKRKSEYVEDPNPIDISNPIIYIYNTHQLEAYSKSNVEIYNITPTVMTASYILRERLNKLGIPTIVENADFTEMLTINNWTYASSYKVSRGYITAAKEKYKSLKYYIDLHRDSTNGNASTITINDKKYARVMFVVGLDNKNYQPNLDLAQKLHLIIEGEYPSLSKGVLTKKGKGVNGVYNQDLDTNMFLVEVGGTDSTIEEISNSIDILANTIYKYIKEN